jgi:hypothetical protein
VLVVVTTEKNCCWQSSPDELPTFPVPFHKKFPRSTASAQIAEHLLLRRSSHCRKVQNSQSAERFDALPISVSALPVILESDSSGEERFTKVNWRPGIAAS